MEARYEEMNPKIISWKHWALVFSNRPHIVTMDCAAPGSHLPFLCRNRKEQATERNALPHPEKFSGVTGSSCKFYSLGGSVVQRHLGPSW